MPRSETQDGDYTQPDVLNDPGLFTPPTGAGGTYDRGPGGRIGYTDPPVRDPTPTGATVGTQPLPRAPSSSAVNQNPYFDPGTNITPGVDIPLKGKDPAASAPTAPTAFDHAGWVNSQLAAAQSTDDPNYWITHVSNDPNVHNPATRDSALGYWAGRIAQGDGALGVRQGTIQKFQDGGQSTPSGPTGPSVAGTGPAPGQGGGTGFADPAYQALNALAQARITSLQQPQSFPQLDTLMQQLQAQQAVNKQRAGDLASKWGSRVTELQQPLLTQPQVVQQRAMAENNLLGSRDAALANARANQSARGFAPTSGLADDAARQINENASNQQGQIEARLQQGNIGTDEARRNEATQLQGLITQALNGGDATALQEQAQTADLENQLYQTDQQRQTQQLATAQIPVDLTNTGFHNASSAISSPNGAFGSLMPLLQMAMTGQNNQFNQANSQASGLSQIIQQLLQSIH